MSGATLKIYTQIRKGYKMQIWFLKTLSWYLEIDTREARFTGTTAGEKNKQFDPKMCVPSSLEEGIGEKGTTN